MNGWGVRVFALMWAVLLSFGVFAGEAKNVILLIGDGMGMGQIGTTLLYSRTMLGRDLRMVELMKPGRTAIVLNDTADAMVTESAAAAGQIATGKRMLAGAISMAEDGKTPLRTLLEIAQDQGKAVGLVTTSGITDATPAAFAAHLAKRSDEASAAEQELQHRADVLMGGRRQFFLPESAGGKRKDGRDLVAEARAAGYAYATTAEEMQGVGQTPLLGLFNSGNMSFELDRARTQEPSLAAMTVKTLQLLSASKKGFFAMIEGGRIDHAAHRNDAAATIRDTLAFDEAVGVAIDFAKAHRGTLVLVTADHETGGMAVIGHSKTSKDYVGADFKAIERIDASFEVVLKELGAKPTPERIRDAVKQHFAIDLTDAEVETVARDTLKSLDPANYNYDLLHSLAFVLRPYLRVAFVTQTHTAAPLALFGTGPGSERVGGLMHNTEIFGLIRDAMMPGKRGTAKAGLSSR